MARHADAPRTGPAPRRALVDGYADRAYVVVALLGLGFWSATLAGAMAGFASLLRRGRLEVTTNIESASDRLARELVGLNAEQLVADYERLYRHMCSLPDARDHE